MPGRKKGISV